MHVPRLGLWSRLFPIWALLVHAALQPVEAQQDATPPTIPIAHWRFEEGTGTTTTDVLGRFPGTLSTGASFTNAGIAGNALALDDRFIGSVNFGDILPLTNTAFSISAWFKTPPGDVSMEGVIVGRHRPWFENGYYLLVNGNGGTLAAFGGAGAFAVGSPTINDGQWHHAVVVSSGSGNVRLHLDGGPPMATAQGGPVIPSPADFMIGGIDPGPPARRFHGFIDEVQVYDLAIDQASVDFLHDHPGLNLNQRDVITFIPEPGPVPNPVTISLLTTVGGGQIRYTLDDTEPTLTSTAYTGPFSLPVSARLTLRARAFLNGFPASEVRSATYEPDPGLHFRPFAEHFTNKVEVTLATSLAGAALQYTSDGSEPVASSPVYSTPLLLTNQTTLKARAFLNGFPVSVVITKTYRRVYAFDNEGIPAAWREQYWGPEFRTDARAGAETDPDADGSTNIQEFVAGTNPLDPRSGFLLHVRAIPELRFVSVPGQKYRILRRAAVSDPNPTALAEVTATGPELLYIDHEAGVVANPAFYFVVPIP